MQAEWVEDVREVRRRSLVQLYTVVKRELLSGARVVHVPPAWSQEITGLLEKDGCTVQFMYEKLGEAVLKVDV